MVHCVLRKSNLLNPESPPAKADAWWRMRRNLHEEGVKYKPLHSSLLSVIPFLLKQPIFWFHGKYQYPQISSWNTKSVSTCFPVKPTDAFFLLLAADWHVNAGHNLPERTLPSGTGGFKTSLQRVVSLLCGSPSKKLYQSVDHLGINILFNMNVQRWS